MRFELKMGNTILPDLFGIIIGSFILKWVYDKLSEPKLEIMDIIKKDFDQEDALKSAGVDPLIFEYFTVEVKIQNKQRKFLNKAAENCICWFKLTDNPEKYQLPWTLNDGPIILNVGDYQYVKLCGRNKGSGKIVIPIDSKYYDYVHINKNNESNIRGEIIVTSANGKGDSKNIIIKSINENRIDVDFEKK